MKDRKNIGKYLTSLGLINKGVEVGVFKGEFSKQILSKWPGTLYMIDPWRPLGKEYIDDSNHKNHSVVYSESMGNIGGFEDRAIMIRSLSEQAVDLFEDESLDFVYIDANHTYDYVKKDIELWYPKIKKGGLVSGDDYINMEWYTDPNFLPNGKDKHIYTAPSLKEKKGHYNGIFGVNPAVDEFCKENDYIVNVTKGTWFGTWFFIKKVEKNAKTNHGLGVRIV